MFLGYNFLAPGTSYSQFLKAFKIEEKIGFLPYEWFNPTEKLQDTDIPGYDTFYSKLKKLNVLEADIRQWRAEGMKMNQPPNGQTHYVDLQWKWLENEMATFRDFLLWYNNLDVGPFVTAVKKLQCFYFEKGIDVFKTSISVPGIARNMLFKAAQQQRATFAVCDKGNQDLYRTIKQNIVGGPSIIFTRHHKAGKTFIRQNPDKPYKRVIGLDANALYLGCIAQSMPVGAFIRCREEDNLTPIARDRYMMMFHWLDWISKTEGKTIMHKCNSGKEKRIGPYLLDGYEASTKTIYEYYGCYFHGQDCRNTNNVKSERWCQNRSVTYECTLQRA